LVLAGSCLPASVEPLAVGMTADIHDCAIEPIERKETWLQQTFEGRLTLRLASPGLYESGMLLSLPAGMFILHSVEGGGLCAPSITTEAGAGLFRAGCG
jgi:hypothetical protein